MDVDAIIDLYIDENFNFEEIRFQRVWEYKKPILIPISSSNIRECDSPYENYNTINSIALPSSLTEGVYKVCLLADQGWKERITGPDSLVIAGSNYGGKAIAPRCINGTIAMPPEPARGPALYWNCGKKWRE